MTRPPWWQFPGQVILRAAETMGMPAWMASPWCPPHWKKARPINHGAPALPGYRAHGRRFDERRGAPVDPVTLPLPGLYV